VAGSGVGGRGRRARRPADARSTARGGPGDARASAAVDETLGAELNEPNVARAIATALPPGATVFVAASMPVRDLETFWPVRDDAPRVLSNRGANGIDGTLASAFGVAASVAAPVVALVGDVALAHDIGALLCARRLGVKLTIVLVDNAGGAVFDHLPVARQTDVYEHHVATPPGVDFRHAAELYALAYLEPDTLAEFAAALTRQTAAALIHIRTDRAAARDLHERVAAAVSRAPAAAPRA
jgi:2-succinyl-5-enolpyruvyl-6-hydroxy-3-cyclohexene-1-carboxylate synthase